MAFEQKEFRLHAAAVRFLRTVCPDCIIYHPANGEYRRPETARRLKAEGVLPGVFDLVMIDPQGKHFYLEAKSDTGRLSEVAAVVQERADPAGRSLCGVPVARRYSRLHLAEQHPS
jgi:hypothetical protein